MTPAARSGTPCDTPRPSPRPRSTRDSRWAPAPGGRTGGTVRPPAWHPHSTRPACSRTRDGPRRHGTRCSRTPRRSRGTHRRSPRRPRRTGDTGRSAHVHSGSSERRSFAADQGAYTARRRRPRAHRPRSRSAPRRGVILGARRLPRRDDTLRARGWSPSTSHLRRSRPRSSRRVHSRTPRRSRRKAGRTCHRAGDEGRAAGERGATPARSLGQAAATLGAGAPGDLHAALRGTARRVVDARCALRGTPAAEPVQAPEPGTTLRRCAAAFAVRFAATHGEEREKQRYCPEKHAPAGGIVLAGGAGTLDVMKISLERPHGVADGWFDTRSSRPVQGWGAPTSIHRNTSCLSTMFLVTFV
jgi:hypothetical protein